jgi:hypothetical protein
VTAGGGLDSICTTCSTCLSNQTLAAAQRPQHVARPRVHHIAEFELIASSLGISFSSSRHDYH